MFKLNQMNVAALLELLSTKELSKEGSLPKASKEVLQEWLNSPMATIRVSAQPGVRHATIAIVIDKQIYSSPADTVIKKTLIALLTRGEILLTVLADYGLIVTCSPEQETLARELFK